MTSVFIELSSCAGYRHVHVLVNVISLCRYLCSRDVLHVVVVIIIIVVVIIIIVVAYMLLLLLLLLSLLFVFFVM